MNRKFSNSNMQRTGNETGIWNTSTRKAFPVVDTPGPKVWTFPVLLDTTKGATSLFSFTEGSMCDFSSARQVVVKDIEQNSRDHRAKRFRRYNRFKAADLDHPSAEGKTNDKPTRPDETLEGRFTACSLDCQFKNGKTKTFRGSCEGDLQTNSSYFIFHKTADGIQIFPVDEWVTFSASYDHPASSLPASSTTACDGQAGFDSALQVFENRNKRLSRWCAKTILRSSGLVSAPTAVNTAATTSDDEGVRKLSDDDDDGDGGKPKGRSARDKFALTEAEEWVESDDESEEDCSKPVRSGPNKDTGVGSAAAKKVQSRRQANVKSGRTRRLDNQEDSEFSEESDDGDRDADEVDYSDDESSSDDSEVEEKGVDEEMKKPNKPSAIHDLDDSEKDDDEDDDDDDDTDQELTEGGKAIAKLLHEYDEADKSNDDESFDDSDDYDDDDFEQGLKPALKILLNVKESEKPPSASGSKVPAKRASSKLSSCKTDSSQSGKKSRANKSGGKSTSAQQGSRTQSSSLETLVSQAISDGKPKTLGEILQSVRRSNTRNRSQAGITPKAIKNCLRRLNASVKMNNANSEPLYEIGPS